MSNTTNTTLYELAKKSQDNVMYIERIIEMFDPKIQRSLLQTTYPKREDLYQELRLKLIDIILNYDVDATPGFWDLQKNLQDSV